MSRLRALEKILPEQDRGLPDQRGEGEGVMVDPRPAWQRVSNVAVKRVLYRAGHRAATSMQRLGAERSPRLFDHGRGLSVCGLPSMGSYRSHSMSSA